MRERGTHLEDPALISLSPPAALELERVVVDVVVGSSATVVVLVSPAAEVLGEPEGEVVDGLLTVGVDVLSVVLEDDVVLRVQRMRSWRA